MSEVRVLDQKHAELKKVLQQAQAVVRELAVEANHFMLVQPHTAHSSPYQTVEAIFRDIEHGLLENAIGCVVGAQEWTRSILTERE